MNEEFIYIGFVLFVFSPIIVKKIINKCKKEEELPVITSSPSPKRRRDNLIFSIKGLLNFTRKISLFLTI